MKKSKSILDLALGFEVFPLFEKVNADNGSRAGRAVLDSSHMKFDEIDTQLATPARVAILATMADGGDWLFADLRRATGLADGNLHVQARRLKEAGYIASEKVARGGRRVTSFRLTGSGRDALEAHVRLLRRALDGSGRGNTGEDTGEEAVPRRKRRDEGRVW